VAAAAAAESCGGVGGRRSRKKAQNCRGGGGGGGRTQRRRRRTQKARWRRDAEKGYNAGRWFHQGPDASREIYPTPATMEAAPAVLLAELEGACGPRNADAERATSSRCGRSVSPRASHSPARCGGRTQERAPGDGLEFVAGAVPHCRRESPPARPQAYAGALRSSRHVARTPDAAGCRRAYPRLFLAQRGARSLAGSAATTGTGSRACLRTTRSTTSSRTRATCSTPRPPRAAAARSSVTRSWASRSRTRSNS